MRRFLTLGIPTSIQNPLEWALSTSARVGALRTCMALLLALKRSVLQTLMARWHHRDIRVFLEHDPSFTVADPLFETWYFDLIQIRRLTLIMSTSSAPKAPNATPRRHPLGRRHKVFVFISDLTLTVSGGIRGSLPSQTRSVSDIEGCDIPWLKPA